MDVQILWPQKSGDKNLEVLLAFSSKNGKSRYKEEENTFGYTYQDSLFYVYLALGLQTLTYQDSS